MTSVFETETCTRCSGSGKYSYCQMYGDTCFKCSGSGCTYTTRGLAARTWWKAQRSIKFADIKIGMRVKIDGFGTFTVRTIEVDTEPTSWSGPEKTPRYGTTIRGEKMGYTVYDCDADQITVELILSKDEQRKQLEAAVAYQSTLTKAGAPRKR